MVSHSWSDIFHLILIYEYLVDAFYDNIPPFHWTHYYPKLPFKVVLPDGQPHNYTHTQGETPPRQITREWERERCRRKETKPRSMSRSGICNETVETWPITIYVPAKRIMRCLGNIKLLKNGKLGINLRKIIWILLNTLNKQNAFLLEINSGIRRRRPPPIPRSNKVGKECKRSL